MNKFLKKFVICMVSAVLILTGGVLRQTAVSILGEADVKASDKTDVGQIEIASLQKKSNVETQKKARYSESKYWYESFKEASTYDLPYSDNYDVGVAVDGTIYLDYGDTDLYGEIQYEWKTDDENIQITENGDQAVVKGKSTGTAAITVTAKGKNWYSEEDDIETKTVKVQITNPKLKTTKIGIVQYYDGKIQTTGVSTAGSSRIWYDDGDSDNFYVYDDGSFYSEGKQTRNVKVYADGKYLGTVTIKATNPTWNVGYYMVKKGKTKSFAVKGASGYTPVTYKIGNTKYATVSKAGKVKGKKYGKTSLSVRVDGASGKIDLYVVKSKVYTAVNKAHSICKSRPKYSQAKRMKKGYVDCSSFVWKSYKSAKVYLGSKTYAPTAANMAKWCSKKKKLLKFSSYNGKSGKLKPGDLIFYKKRSGKNGRYKNIDHVAMYVGNDTIVHADGSSVSYSSPWYRKAAAIARPVK